MNVFIYNVHKDPGFREILNKTFVQKEPIPGLSKAIECEVISQMGGYLFVNVSATDNEIIIKMLNTFKSKYHIYFKVINFGVELKFINITKDFKFESKGKVVKVTPEMGDSIKDSMLAGNKFPVAKKEKIRKINFNDLLNELDANTKLDIKHDGQHVRSLGTLNGAKVITNIPENCEIHLEGGKFTTNNDEVRASLIEKGFVDNAVPDPQ
jgi:hypothetical protein